MTGSTNIAIQASRRGYVRGRAARRRDACDTRAFTLIELLIVCGIIVMVAAIAPPSVAQIFTAGTDAQAYNLLAGQLAAARALAIRESTYAGVHVQLADQADGLEDVCFMAVVIGRRDSSGDIVFWHNAPDGSGIVDAADFGYQPQRVPGNYWFGQLNGSTRTFLSGSDFQNVSSAEQRRDFTTFTIVFNSSGQAVTRIEGGRPEFDATDGAFGTGASDLWDLTEAERDTEAATAVTMFHYPDFEAADDPGTYLDTHGQLIPVNVHTGELFERK